MLEFLHVTPQRYRLLCCARTWTCEKKYGGDEENVRERIIVPQVELHFFSPNNKIIYFSNKGQVEREREIICRIEGCPNQKKQ